MFSKFFLDYIQQEPGLQTLYGNYPDLSGFQKQLATKKFSYRKELVTDLKNQYQHLSNPPDLDILLQENTFTVTTGHQLNIYTGPLYVILKIVSTINLAKQLKNQYPEYNFVPVYWMATEDHDLEEIAYFYLFGQKFNWDTPQTGAVGRMNPDTIPAITENLKDKPGLFLKAYSENKTLGDAVRQYMNELFGGYGLVCVDGDSHQLKKLFSPVMEDDLFTHTAKKELDKNSELLQKLGYKPQVNARDINLFYLENNLRERIEEEGNQYVVVNTDIHFSKDKIKELLKTSPEKFSPNVILRPLYQETILPNLAYLGGPSEAVYWLQLKGMFDAFSTAYPIIMPRNFAMVINKGQQKRMEKLGIQPQDLFLDEVTLRKNYVANNTENTLSLDQEKNNITEAFENIVKKAVEVDSTLKGSVEAEKVKIIKQIEHLESKIKKSEEQKFETAINQLTGLKEKLFPNGTPQERHDNFLNFYLNDPDFIGNLIDTLDPLDFRMNVIFS